MKAYTFTKTCEYCGAEFTSANTRVGGYLCPRHAGYRERIKRVLNGRSMGQLTPEMKEAIERDRTVQLNHGAFDPKRPHRLERNHPDYGK